MTDPFAHFSEQLGAWSEPPPPRQTKAADGAGRVNKQRQNDLIDKVRSRLANESANIDDSHFDHVEAERLAVSIDDDDDPDLPD